MINGGTVNPNACLSWPDFFTLATALKLSQLSLCIVSELNLQKITKGVPHVRVNNFGRPSAKNNQMFVLCTTRMKKRLSVFEKWEDSQKRQKCPSWKFYSGARNNLFFFFHFESQNNLGQRPQSLGKRNFSFI